MSENWLEKPTEPGFWWGRWRPERWPQGFKHVPTVFQIVPNPDLSPTLVIAGGKEIFEDYLWQKVLPPKEDEHV